MLEGLVRDEPLFIFAVPFIPSSTHDQPLETLPVPHFTSRSALTLLSSAV
jgi:hypothetical protein